MAETVRFITADGVEIVGDFLSAEPGAPVALLLHMMPADRTSWRPFADRLLAAGYGSLAIDLRGHGESVNQGNRTLNYKQFGDAEHRASIRDVEAATAFLQSRGVSPDRIVIIGASIGANLALQYAREYAAIPAVALLSPGLDYRGVKTEPLVATLSPGQGALLLASREDEYSFETIRTLARAMGERVTKMEFDGLGHGTTMFERRPELMDEVIEWLKNVMKHET
ncbi:MAG: alpha/beta fold hydrolase [Patescibacteria group bacterium]